MKNVLQMKRIGIDTYNEAVIYMRPDCHICRSEGFEAHARIALTYNNLTIIATLNIIHSDILSKNEAGLSEYAWKLLKAKQNELVHLSHPKPLDSLQYIRRKIFGHTLSKSAIESLIHDLKSGFLSDIHISAFITACATGKLNKTETTYLTGAMVNSGSRLEWSSNMIVDKHCIGGLPGNRTSLIVVPIIAAAGLIIPKTSSRAITSPAGTADTMETLAPVNLSLVKMKQVVEKENGCIVWGGTVDLSPADDILIRVERSLNLDSDAQLVASVLSKKIAAGSTHVVVDIPLGPTCKVRDLKTAHHVEKLLVDIGKKFNLTVNTIISDGSEPVGFGIGPALEARDVLAVLHNHSDAPQDLKERALCLAAQILESAGMAKKEASMTLAKAILENGKALRKFEKICDAQGGMREPPKAPYTKTILAKSHSKVLAINNRMVARLAKLAGAPQSSSAGIDLHAKTGARLLKGQPLFTIHTETKGELAYALASLHSSNGIYQMEKIT